MKKQDEKNYKIEDQVSESRFYRILISVSGFLKDPDGDFAFYADLDSHPLDLISMSGEIRHFFDDCIFWSNKLRRLIVYIEKSHLPEKNSVLSEALYEIRRIVNFLTSSAKQFDLSKLDEGEKVDYFFVLQESKRFFEKCTQLAISLDELIIKLKHNGVNFVIKDDF